MRPESFFFPSCCLPIQRLHDPALSSPFPVHLHSAKDPTSSMAEAPSCKKHLCSLTPLSLCTGHSLYLKYPSSHFWIHLLWRFLWTQEVELITPSSPPHWAHLLTACLPAGLDFWKWGEWYTCVMKPSALCVGYPHPPTQLPLHAKDRLSSF